MKRKCLNCGEYFKIDDEADLHDPKAENLCLTCWQDEEDMRIEGEHHIDEFSDADPGL